MIRRKSLVTASALATYGDCSILGWISIIMSSRAEDMTNSSRFFALLALASVDNVLTGEGLSSSRGFLFSVSD